MTKPQVFLQRAANKNVVTVTYKTPFTDESSNVTNQYEGFWPLIKCEIKHYVIKHMRE